VKTLVCMGDSLTEGSDIPVGHTWPAMVGNALNVDVINCGIGGDTTAGMLARFYPEVVERSPAFVLIMGGTNDLWWGLEVNTILGTLFSMVVQARHHGITPILGLPLPVNVPAARAADFSPPLEGYDRFKKKMEALLEALVSHAVESEVALIDLHRPFLSDKQRIREDLFLPDGLHPNPSGHRTVASTICDSFRQWFHFHT